MEIKAVIYEFGDFRLDARQRVLSRGDEVITLTPKGFEVLLLLIRNHGQTLEKEELIRAAWPDSFVEESNLTQSIFVLRKVLGDDRNGHGLIQTIPRRGYKFTAPVRELETGAGDSLLPAGYWNRHSPFRGLQVFEAEDSWLFFGRDREIEDLLEHLAQSPVLVLIGNSGSGKSSLVRAGLLAALQQGRFQDAAAAAAEWRTVVVRPSGAPFDYLAEVLPGALSPEMNSTSRAQFIADCRNKFPVDKDALRNAIGALVTDRRRVLLVVDQFEELFTLNPDRGVRDRYIDLLLAAGLDGHYSLHIVVVLRADFYPQCLEHPALTRCLQTNVYNLPRMARQQLRESIERRLVLAGAQAEPGLIDSLLDDAGEEPGNLALLEHAVDQLWQASGGSGCVLTSEAYSNIGRLRGALGKHADRVYESLDEERSRELVQRIFLELVQLGESAYVQDTRRRVPKANLLALGEPSKMPIEDLLSRLSTSRLISIGEESGQAFVEVSHEALIREWQRLREWITENREALALQRKLIRAAEEWRELGEDSGALLQGARLVQAEEWISKHGDAQPLVREFMQASVSLRAETEWKERTARERELKQQKRAALRLRWFAGALFTLLMLAMAAAWFAHRQKILADSRALAAQAEGLLSQDHGRALDLAIKSWELGKTEEARMVVAKAFAQPLRTFTHEGDIESARFSPDGQKILTASDGDDVAKVWSIQGQLLLTLKGHTARINNAVFSPDGGRILTASYDHTARLWNSADGMLVAVLQGHTDRVQDALFSLDGTRIVTASWDGTARVWDAADGHLLTVLSGHTKYVNEAHFSPDGRRIVTAGYDNTARLWDAGDGHLLRTLEGHSAPLLDAVFFQKEDRIITSSWDGTARIWDSKNGRQLFVLQHSGAVEYAGFSPDGTRILTASHDHTARVWNSIDGRLLLTLLHDGQVLYAEYSRDGRYILTSSYDHTARVWNSPNGRLLAILHGHTGILNNAAFSPDGQQIITASADHTARLWSTVAARSGTVLQGHTGYLLYGEFFPDDQVVVSASFDNTARIWNAADGRLLHVLRGHTDAVLQAAISPDGQSIVTGSADKSVRVWSRADGHLIAILQGHTDQVTSVQFSPDGRHIITSGFDHTARLWSASTFQCVAILAGHTGHVAATFSPDSHYVLSTSVDHTARVWDALNGHLTTILYGHSGAVYRSSFSPDNTRIVTASADHTARIWRTDNGRSELVLNGDASSVFSAVFSHDGQRIVTASSNGTARLWNAADGQLITLMQGHGAQIHFVTFSPNDRQIVTASFDNTARVWDGFDGHLITVLQGHTGSLFRAAFSHDGQSILTVSQDQTGRIWQLLTLDDVDRILAE